MTQPSWLAFGVRWCGPRSPVGLQTAPRCPGRVATECGAGRHIPLHLGMPCAHVTCAHTHSSSSACPTSRLQPHLLLTTVSHSTDQANTAHWEGRHTHWPGHHGTLPLWEGKAQAHWHHSARSSRGPRGRLGQNPGGARRAGSSPGAEAVRHPPCQTEKQRTVTLPSAQTQRAQDAHRRARALLPVEGIQGTEDDAAHGVVSPEEEPVGTREGATVRPRALPPGHRGAGPRTLSAVWREEQSVHSSQVRRHATPGKDVLGRLARGKKTATGGREAGCGGKSQHSLRDRSNRGA